MRHPTPEERQNSTLSLQVPERSGRWFALLRWAGFVALVAITAGLLGGVGLYFHFSKGLPDIPRVDRYWPPIVSEVYTDDAVLAGEFYNERRKVVSYERIPKRLIQAFIASEDSGFFDHGGIDLLGTARAAFKTILKKTTGAGSVQGGSSLTQQTAKAVLISSEGYKTATQKSLTRKVREAILARRLEKALSKEEILFLYLNNVFLGHHSYGVQAAAENYYRKDVSALTLAEMALVAGLPQAPSRYSPFLNPDAAKKRRGYVLRRMLEEKMISKAEHDEAAAAEVKVYPVEDVFHEFAPYFVEEVRRNVVNRFGNKNLLEEGLRVFTTMDAERQRAAQDSMFQGLLAVDKRQGFRGPLAQLATVTERTQFIEKSSKVLGDEPLTEGQFYIGMVTNVDTEGQMLDVQIGKHVAKLPLLGLRWARKLNPEGYYPGSILSSVKYSKLQPGDLIVVRAAKPKQLYDDREQYDGKQLKTLDENKLYLRLEQEPELQGTIVSIDPHRQYLVAMVGGYDFDANEYNRAFQACRQPGSSFKPLVYSAAIEQLGWTEATVIVDSPIVYDDPDNQTRWKPENYSEEFHGDVLLRTALVNSMNIPAVKTFAAVGVKNMSEWSKKLGLSKPMNQDFSAALGSSCVLPFELADVYATFNRYGVRKPTHFIRKIEDRFGRTLEDHSAFDDAWAPFADRVAAGYARLFEDGEQVMAPETGMILTHLLRGVVLDGTGGPASALHKPAAGKTGTTNDSFDAWFAGYTRDLVTVTWVGYDLNPHPLGKFETGGRAALPIWLNYMKHALEGRSQPEFEPLEGSELVRIWVDEKTGKRARANSKNAKEMWFKKDTEPKDVAPEKGQVDPNAFMMEAPN